MSPSTTTTTTNSIPTRHHMNVCFEIKLSFSRRISRGRHRKHRLRSTSKNGRQIESENSSKNNNKFNEIKLEVEEEVTRQVTIHRTTNEDHHHETQEMAKEAKVIREVTMDHRPIIEGGEVHHHPDHHSRQVHPEETITRTTSIAVEDRSK